MWIMYVLIFVGYVRGQFIQNIAIIKKKIVTLWSWSFQIEKNIYIPK